MFADLVYLRGFNSSVDIQDVQTDLNSIANHISTTKLLSINNTKTHFQIIKSNHLGPVEEPEITLSDQIITATKNVKYLGVIVDEYLNYSVHNQKQGAKQKKLFGYIYRQLRRLIVISASSLATGNYDYGYSYAFGLEHAIAMENRLHQKTHDDTQLYLWLPVLRSWLDHFTSRC